MFLTGLNDTFICDGMKKKYFSCQSFISLLMGFCGCKTSIDQASQERIKILRNCIINRAHLAERDLLSTTTLQDCVLNPASTNTVPVLDLPSLSRSNHQNVESKSRSTKSSTSQPTTGTSGPYKHQPSSTLIHRENLKQNTISQAEY